MKTYESLTHKTKQTILEIENTEPLYLNMKQCLNVLSKMRKEKNVTHFVNAFYPDLPENVKTELIDYYKTQNSEEL